MLQKLKNALWRFLYGRYGTDKLNMVLLGLGVALCLVGMVIKNAVVTYLSYVPLLTAIFRTFSKNLPARRRENQALLDGVTRIKDRKNRYFKCPKCSQRVRVPRGKGTVKIRCPKCSEQFVKKT